MNPADEAFRDQVRGFLANEVGADLHEAGRLRRSRFQDPEPAIAFQRVLYEKGWAAPGWPVEFGGTGWSLSRRYIFAQECARAETPWLIPTGLNMCGPTLIGHGSAAQRQRFLPAILSGDHIWCQGYSEPGAGSDLASLSTAAVSDGADYVINGSKIWTTYAHCAHWMFALVRTSHEGKPQQGISFLLIDMASPGIRVRPITNIAGEHEFNQVFLDDVRVPKSNRVGAENEGWTIAKYLLEFERFNMASVDLWQMHARIAALAAALTVNGRALHQDESYRHRRAALEAQIRAIEISEQRVLSNLSLGQRPGAVSSQLKILQGEVLQSLDEFALDLAGYYAAPYQPEATTPGRNSAPIGPEASATFAPLYLNNRMRTIAGGSSEVQRNIVAKSVLGL